MSRLALVAALIALAPLPIAFHAPTPGVVATPLALDPGDPGRRRVGKLTWLGGWVLRGSDRRFGGISSMTIQNGAFVLLSDTGIVTRFRFEGSGPVSGYDLHPLPDGPGDPLRKINRDSESSTYDAMSGHVWAGFETRNEIWRYTAGFAAADGHAAPAAMAKWPNNEGAEAMVRLHDGRFLVFAETLPGPGPGASRTGLLFPGDPVDGGDPVHFAFRTPPGFDTTDATELPDGRIAILMRHFSPKAGIMTLTPGFSAALLTIDPKAIRPGTLLPSRLVARLAPPLTVDNMEALAVERRGSRTILWMASDDNFFLPQRTLLLAFELAPGA